MPITERAERTLMNEYLYAERTSILGLENPTPRVARNGRVRRTTETTQTVTQIDPIAVGSTVMANPSTDELVFSQRALIRRQLGLFDLEPRLIPTADREEAYRAFQALRVSPSAIDGLSNVLARKVLGMFPVSHVSLMEPGELKEVLRAIINHDETTVRAISMVAGRRR